MTQDYERSKDFWNELFASDTPEKIEGRAFDDPTFTRLLETGLKDAETVLDYGCGAGWGLFEMYFCKPSVRGVGVDPSENGVRYAERCAALSGLSEALTFVCGDASLLRKDEYDFILTVNLLDVVPLSVCESVLAALRDALKPGRSMLVCLNPEFTEEEMTGMIGMEKRGDYYYKNGVLRARRASRLQWKTLFERYFTVTESATFALTEREREHPRVAYLMRKD